MNDKVTYRLCAMKYWDPYKDKIQAARNNPFIKKLISQSNKSGLDTIILPSDFDSIFLENIKLEVLQNSKTGKPILKDINYNWEKFELELKQSLIGNKPGSLNTVADYLSNIKYEKKALSISYTLNIILNLTKEAFPIIVEFFPFEEYGLPSLDLLEAVMNKILKNDGLIERIDPYLCFNSDPYGILYKKENEFLKQLLNDNGINYKELMADFNAKQLMFQKLLLLNPTYNIVVNSTIQTTQLRDSVPKLIKSVKKMNRMKKQKIFLTNRKLFTIEKYAATYFDLKFNKNMTNGEIAKLLGLSFKVVSNEINDLAKYTGFEIELRKIPKGKFQKNKI